MRFLKLVHIFTIFILSVGISADSDTETDKITVAILNTEIPPYVYFGKTPDDKTGITIDILNLLKEELNLNLVLKPLPYLRIMRDVRIGNVDGFMSWSWNSERSKEVSYPMLGDLPDRAKRVVDDSYVIYTLKSSGIAWNGDSFNRSDIVVGINRGYSVINEVKQHDLKIDASTNNTSTNFNRLLAKRVDAVVDIERIGDIIIKANPQLSEHVIKLEIPLITKDYYLVLSNNYVKNHPELAKKIWNALESIREEHLATIMARYPEQ